VNRAQRRRIARGDLQVQWLVALDDCEFCGAPACPLCGRHAVKCECCDEFNCDHCGVYVLPPTRKAN
jgi:hypothetical protein